MSTFRRLARYYDVFYGQRNFEKECDFLIQAWALCGVRPENILDLAGGTGNHGLVLAARGYKVCGVDASAEMLWLYGQKAAERGLAVDLLRQDLSKIALSRQFDAALCMGDAIGYLGDDSELCRFFLALAEQVKPYGVFVFDFWHTPAVVSSYEPVRSRDYQMGTSKVTRVARTSLDLVKKIALVDYQVREFVGDSVVDEFSEEHHMRFFTVEEIIRLLEGSGWEIVFSCPSYEFGRPVGDDTFHVAVIARPKLLDPFSV